MSHSLIYSVTAGRAAAEQPGRENTRENEAFPSGKRKGGLLYILGYTKVTVIPRNSAFLRKVFPPSHRRSAQAMGRMLPKSRLLSKKVGIPQLLTTDSLDSRLTKTRKNMSRPRMPRFGRGFPVSRGIQDLWEIYPKYALMHVISPS